MSREDPDFVSDSHMRERALSRWDNEGGAGPQGPALHPETVNTQIPIPELTNTELVALRVRMIALENIVISLLATASDQQLELTREMARYISPRPGFTQHPLTTHAATHMIDLIERSSRFRKL